MIPKRFEDIQLADIEALVENSVPESRTLDYKEALPGDSDEAKRTFLEDVVSFTNAAGGDIVFGLRDVRENGRSTGRPEIVGLGSDLNEDATKLRIENVIRDGVKPRIPSCQIKFIDAQTRGKLCVLRLPQSWSAPHMVTFKVRSGFFSRNSAGKYPLDITEIRNAFTLSASIKENLKNFRGDRTAKIIAGETAVPMAHGPKVVLHIVPVQSFSSELSIDLAYLMKNHQRAQPIYLNSGWSPRYNFDGFLSYAAILEGNSRSYVQFFRDGRVEAATSRLIRTDMEKRIPSVMLEQQIIQSLTQYLETLRTLDVSGPVVVMLTLIGVHGFRMGTANSFAFFDSQGDAIDRDILFLPDLLVEDLAEPAHQILQPAFDALWNACGYLKSENYDDQGNWSNKGHNR